MKRCKKLTLLLFALIFSAAMLLAGCGGGGSSTDYSSLQNDVVKGSNVFVTDNGIVFFGYNNLLCSAVTESGKVFDFVVEAGCTGDVYSLAVYDDAIYVSASDGIF